MFGEFAKSALAADGLSHVTRDCLDLVARVGDSDGKADEAKTGEIHQIVAHVAGVLGRYAALAENLLEARQLVLDPISIKMTETMIDHLEVIKVVVKNIL